MRSYKLQHFNILRILVMDQNIHENHVLRVIILNSTVFNRYLCNGHSTWKVEVFGTQFLFNFLEGSQKGFLFVSDFLLLDFPFFKFLIRGHLLHCKQMWGGGRLAGGGGLQRECRRELRQRGIAACTQKKMFYSFILQISRILLLYIICILYIKLLSKVQ